MSRSSGFNANALLRARPRIIKRSRMSHPCAAPGACAPRPVRRCPGAC